MNSFYNKSQVLDYDYNFNFDLSEFNALDILPDDSFSAFTDLISGEDVLMQDVKLPNISTPLKNIADRLEPFFNKPLSVMNQNESEIRGFKPNFDNTYSARKQSVLTAKFISNNLQKLNQSLLILKNNAPNNNVKSTISNLNTQVFVSNQIMKNIINQLTNNTNSSKQSIMEEKGNFQFCHQLKQSLILADKSFKGMLKLKRIVNIPNINNQLNILIISMQNIISTLKDFNIYCR